MNTIKNPSRIQIVLALAALCASGRTAAGEDAALSEAFGSAQKTVQAGKVRLAAVQAASAAKNGIFVTPAIGAWVMDSEDRVGRVIEAYPNGAARYRVADEVRVSNDLAAEIPYGDGLWTGDTLIDRGFDIGTEARIFEGAIHDKKGRRSSPRVHYKVANRWYVAKAFNLSRSVPEYEVSKYRGLKIRPGSSILSLDQRTLTVELVFSDGRVSVARAGGKPEILNPSDYSVISGPR